MPKPDETSAATASSFASRRAAREAHEAEHGPPPATRRHALAAGANAESASAVEVTHVQS